MKAILVVSHGSRSPKTKKEVVALIDNIKTKTQVDIIEYAFLEIEEPSIPEGIQSCIEKGAGEVLLLMNFLNSGRHMDEDIPAIVEEEQKKYPDVKIHMSGPVGQHERIADLFVELIDS